MTSSTARPLSRALLEELFSFPNPVNEVAARLVAGGVVVLALAAIVGDLPWLTLPLAYGFLARVLTGPTLSPLGQLVTRVIAPRLPVAPRLVPGPPKRFAQGMGLGFAGTAAVLALIVHARLATDLVLGALVGAATLESVFGYCLGCKVFALLIRAGVVPDAVCEQCAAVSVGTGPAMSGSAGPVELVS